MTDTITSLIEKLEQAEVGSRELDFWIWLALDRDNTVVPNISDSFQSKSGDEFELYDANERCLGWVGFQLVPYYSLSIDAALVLAEHVLPDYTFRLDMDARRRAYIFPVDGYTIGSKPTEWAAYADAPTAPLALCIALLRAQSEAR